jgi:hypothetical protein
VNHRVRLLSHIYVQLLHLYPRSFRDEFGAEIITHVPRDASFRASVASRGISAPLLPAPVSGASHAENNRSGRGTLAVAALGDEG